jgi:putative FmdB family regulatory protein
VWVNRRTAVPLYDYECVGCGHSFELRQSFHEAGVGICPLCAGKARRKFHAVPVIYKGSGFYTTDYGRPKPPPEDRKEKEDKDGKKVAAKKESSSSAETKANSAAKATSDVAV